jgi:hypothetical protein
MVRSGRFMPRECFRDVEEAGLLERGLKSNVSARVRGQRSRSAVVESRFVWLGRGRSTPLHCIDQLGRAEPLPTGVSEKRT